MINKLIQIGPDVPTNIVLTDKQTDSLSVSFTIPKGYYDKITLVCFQESGLLEEARTSEISVGINKTSCIFLTPGSYVCVIFVTERGSESKTSNCTLEQTCI